MNPFKTLILGLVSLLFVNCQAPHSNASTNQENPTPDDYSAVSSLNDSEKWEGNNVHDPTCIKTDSCYYLYSTDAYYHAPGVEFNPDSIKMGFVPIKKSYDLVHWQFIGWAIDNIPDEIVTHVRTNNNGQGADGIWAPFVKKVGNIYRMYFSVSGFGTNSSCIGLAEATNPEGPFEYKGIVVKTSPESIMNAIDASVITERATGKEWMIYGSYFGGLHAMELNKETGLALKEGDQGHCIARRANGKIDNIEAPEIMYHEESGKYYLFVSYDPLFTYYNIRVGMADSPAGPFKDMFGHDMKDTTNNLPMLTHSFKFEGHPGWSGNAHCCILNDDGKYYMMHQGRLGPDNMQIILQVRELRWLSNGWPVASPERYAGDFSKKEIDESDIVGQWEIIFLKELPETVKLWQGQIPGGGWHYGDDKFNLSEKISFNSDGTTDHKSYTKWQYKKGKLTLTSDDGKTAEAVVFHGHDWEQKRHAIILSGLSPKGYAIWGKK